MVRVLGWSNIIANFESKLSKWKIPLLSIGARSMLVKAVHGVCGIHYMPYFFCQPRLKASWNFEIQVLLGHECGC